MIYIASPYSHPVKSIREDRAYQVGAFTAFYVKRGHVLYSPIASWHHLATEHDMPKGFEFWRRFDYRVLRLCEALWVLMLYDWDESVGVAAEIDLAKILHLPIRYFNGENFAEEAMTPYMAGEV